jgi:cyclopropane fatty-acyl-phospholipid synthase-like methyltransferase
VADPPPSEEAPSRSGGRRAHDFDQSYTTDTPPPWDIGRPQPAFEELAEAHGLVGRVLDVGCGTGEHALMAAARGHPAVGVDISAAAIEQAEHKAEDRGLDARFLVGDALDLSGVDGRFDTVLDCGLFHVFDDEDRPLLVASVAALVPPGGRYHMLCFSDQEPGDWGPRRVSQQELRTSFSRGWSVESIEPVVIDITIDPAGARAWRMTAVRS